MAEHVSHVLIGIGGIGTIAAVTLIFGFLLWVVAPLFLGASVEASAGSERVTRGAVVRAEVDEYGRIAWTLGAHASLEARVLSDGRLLERRDLAGDVEPTSWAWLIQGDGVAAGYADGSARIGTIGVDSELHGVDDATEAERAMAVGELSTADGLLVERMPGDLWRVSRLAVELGPPIALAPGAAVELLDLSQTESASFLAALTGDQRLALYRLRAKENWLTGETTYEAARHDLAYEPDPVRGAPAYLRLSSTGDMLYLAWRDGYVRRYDTRDADASTVAETCDLVPQDGAELTSLQMLVGKTTLVAGDSQGRLTAWFPIKPEHVETGDGAVLVRAHELPDGPAAVTAIGPSARSRTLAVAYADGSLRLVHVTSAQTLAEVRTSSGAAAVAVSIAPKEDRLVAATPAALESWSVDLRHPEASLGALFAPQWYEGYEAPQHAWQSSSGTDAFEPKLGLMPLLYGTVKATFYSMIFGAPIAILAAIYTSEYLSSRFRATLKSTIEIMASLPSVVLGFLAALVIAPLVQDVIASILLSFLTIPLFLLLGAYLFQLLPRGWAIRLGGYPRLGLILLGFVPGVLSARLLGPGLERAFFAGDTTEWLAGQSGAATGGWLLLLLPPVALGAIFAAGYWVNPWLRRISGQWSRTQCALGDFVKFLAVALATLLATWGLAEGLDAAGMDPRGELFGRWSPIGTYSQRNALVVGFVMGFAVIPIVYTLAEDALSSVPGHLRSASLAAGATPWQTAARVILPTAMSGLFSALMIGLGRAVGETMIVLMATGNTPVMEWNVFSGFRTLSANIAVELPEAVQNSTHYRTLFLAALTLFAMTFAINTLAEAVRQRFRRRAYQL